MSNDTSDQWVTRNALAWLLAAQAVSILPLFTYLPIWVPLVWAFSLLWRVQIYRGVWPFPGNKAKAFLGASCIAGLLLSYAGTLGVEPLVAFLVVSFVLKILEVRSRSDVLLVVYVGFIAVAAQFLFFQTMYIAFYGFISVLILISAWNCIYRSQPVPIKKQLWLASVLLLQSLPVMVLLFLVLPRFGSLWHVPLPKQTGVTGFSDTMSPGDFSALSQSSKVAFRVSFDSSLNDSMPSREAWYWRGLVLDRFDGRSWNHDEGTIFRRNKNKRDATLSNVPASWGLVVPQAPETFRYEVLMEPHQQRWLFTLMAPISVQSSANKVSFVSNYLAKTRKPIASRTQYEVVSTSQYLAAPSGLSTDSYDKNTKLPIVSNPRSVELARQWLADGVRGYDLVTKALSMYNASFSYTLRPPPLGTHSVDEFLFFTQKGFCEHFASSFVVLMRAAGIPARVVVGYQGGELNPVENYLIVRQSDAHAWAEVWLPNKGWMRVDPTGAVSPLRIERGLEAALNDDERALISSVFSGAWLNSLSMRLDAVSYNWHQWVLGYDSDRQMSVLKRLFGGTEAWRIGAFFVAIITGFLLIYFIFLTWKGAVEYRYPEQALYAKFVKKLQRKGFSPEVGETPLAFSERISREKKQWAVQVSDITRLYLRIAYEDQGQLLEQLRRHIKVLRLN